jgi:hypothetical protein
MKGSADGTVPSWLYVYFSLTSPLRRCVADAHSSVYVALTCPGNCYSVREITIYIVMLVESLTTT